MINTSNAKWELSRDEQYAVKWFNDNGFTGTIDKQYVSKTKFTITKNEVTDHFELPQGTNGLSVKKYMEQYEKSFEMLCELQKLRKCKEA